MMHRTLVPTAVSGVVLMLALASCSTPESSEPSGAASEGSSSPAAERGDGEAYQDLVETRRPDPGAAALEEELRQAADSGEELALDVRIRRVGDTIDEDVVAADGTVAVSFVGEGDGVSYEISGAPEVFGGEDVGNRPPLQGLFGIEVTGSDDGTPTYTLTRSGDVEPAPRSGEEKCREDGVDERASEAAGTLRDASLEEYGELREEWASAPQLWGTIKGHAAMDGGGDGDILGQLCAPHRE